MKEHRKYIKWYEDFHVARVCIDQDSSLYVYNKIDSVSLDFLDKLAREPHTVVMSCDQVHRTLKETFKYAMVWGASARHVPQRVGLSHVVADEDVVSIVAK